MSKKKIVSVALFLIIVTVGSPTSLHLHIPVPRFLSRLVEPNPTLTIRLLIPLVLAAFSIPVYLFYIFQMPSLTLWHKQIAIYAGRRK